MNEQTVGSQTVPARPVQIGCGLMLGVLLLQVFSYAAGGVILQGWLLLVSLSLCWFAWRFFAQPVRWPTAIGLGLSFALAYRLLSWPPLAITASRWSTSALAISLGLLVIGLAWRAASAEPTVQRRWLGGLWLLVGLQVVWVALDWGYTRQPCGWLDPLRLAVGCSRAVVFAERMRAIVLSVDGTTTAAVGYPDIGLPGDDFDAWLEQFRASPGTVEVRRVDDGRRLATLAHPSYVMDVALSSDGALVATGSADGVLRVWRASDGTALQTIPVGDGPVARVSFAADGLTVAALSGSEPQTLRVWRVSDGTALHQTALPVPATSVVFSRDGRYLLPLISGSEVAMIPIGQSEPLRTIKTDQILGAAVALSSDGQLVATGGLDTRVDVGRSVKIWRVQDGTLLHSITLDHSLPGGTPDRISGVVFSADGTRVAASISQPGSRSNLIRVWQVSDGQLVGTLDRVPGIHSPATDATVFQFSPDGNRLLVARDDGIDSWPAP